MNSNRELTEANTEKIKITPIIIPKKTKRKHHSRELEESNNSVPNTCMHVHKIKNEEHPKSWVWHGGRTLV